MKGHKLGEGRAYEICQRHPCWGLDILNEFWPSGIYSWQQQTRSKKKEGFKPGNGLQTLCGSFYGPLFNLWLKYISTTKPWSCRKAGRTCYTSGTPKATNKGQLDAAAT